jgi:hypothetical protein
MDDLRRYLAWQAKRTGIPRRGAPDRGFAEPEM